MHTFSDLPHDTSLRVEFGPCGEALLDDRSTWHLSLYRFQHTAGEKYSLTGQSQIPTGVGWSCRKAVTDTNIYIQQDTNDPTYQLHATYLHTITALHHEGMLLGCVHPEALIYGVKRSEDDWIMKVHFPTGVVTLQPPEPRGWDEQLSACRAGQHIIVTEDISQSLDVFTVTGNIQHFVHDSDE